MSSAGGELHLFSAEPVRSDAAPDGTELRPFRAGKLLLTLPADALPLVGGDRQNGVCAHTGSIVGWRP